MMTIENSEGEVIRVVSAAEMAASVVEGRGKTIEVGSTKVISVRLPVTLAAKIQGLAQKSGRTRNATISTLLEVGLEEVTALLSPETLEELADITSEHYEDLYPEGHKC